jgi:hypothetical protein
MADLLKGSLGETVPLDRNLSVLETMGKLAHKGFETLVVGITFIPSAPIYGALYIRNKFNQMVQFGSSPLPPANEPFTTPPESANI